MNFNHIIYVKCIYINIYIYNIFLIKIYEYLCVKLYINTI